jgi:hypothetical protein
MGAYLRPLRFPLCPKKHPTWGGARFFRSACYAACCVMGAAQWLAALMSGVRRSGPSPGPQYAGDGDDVTNAPTNSRPEDIAQVAAALAQAMRDAQAVQDQGSTGTPMVAESTQQPDIGQQGSVT